MVDIPPPSILPPGVPGAGPPSSNKNTSYGRVIKPHTGADFSELTLTMGDIIKITSQGESGYWSGTLNGASGVFPSTCVEIVSDPQEIKKLQFSPTPGRGRGRGRGRGMRGRGRGKGGMRHSSYTPASQGLNQKRKKKVVSGHYKNSPLTPPVSSKIPPPVSSKIPPPPARVKTGAAIPPPVKPGSLPPPIKSQGIGNIPPPVNIQSVKKCNSIPGSIPPPIKSPGGGLPPPTGAKFKPKSNSAIQFNQNKAKQGGLNSPKSRFGKPPAIGGNSGSSQKDDVPPRSPRKMPTADDLPELPHRILNGVHNKVIGLPPAVQPRKKIGNELAEKLGNLNLGSGMPPAVIVSQPQNNNENVAPSNEAEELSEEEEKRLKKIEKHKRLRENALTEIWDTERDYIIDIELIISVFIIPLRAMKIVPDQVLYHIFSNLETLINCNREMEKLFNEIFKNGVSADLAVGEVFTKMADYLKMYKIYCSNQQTSLTTVELQKKKNQKFKSYMEVCHSDERCKGLQLQSFLIKPIQRVCKYPLLLRELIKYTPEEHPDYNELQSAFGKINSVVSDINEAQRVAEGLQRILELQEIIDGVDTLVAPGRRYIKEGDLTWYKSSKSKHGEKRHIFVFSDLLLLCNKKGSNKYEKKLAMPLDKAKIIVLADTNYIKHAFEITQPSVKTRCIIAVGSVEEQKAWIKEVKGLIKDFQLKQLRELKQEQKRKANSSIN